MGNSNGANADESATSKIKRLFRTRNEPQIVHQPTATETVQLAEAVVSTPTITPPIFSEIVTGLKLREKPMWAQQLYVELHQFAEHSNQGENTEFVQEMVTLKRRFPDTIAQKDEPVYVRNLNRIYDEYVDPSDAPNMINLSYELSGRLQTLKKNGWEEDGHLLTPQQIWAPAEAEISDLIISNLYHPFKESPEYNVWKNRYGPDYIAWKDAQSAHIDYFGELNEMDYQHGFLLPPDEGSYDYYPYRHHVQLYDTNKYDYYKNDIMNMELIAFNAMIVFIVIAICGLCGLFICLFNVFIGYFYYFKPEMKKTNEVNSYSDHV